jgi:hypothetical protein
VTKVRAADCCIATGPRGRDFFWSEDGVGRRRKQRDLAETLQMQAGIRFRNELRAAVVAGPVVTIKDTPYFKY